MTLRQSVKAVAKVLLPHWASRRIRTHLFWRKVKKYKPYEVRHNYCGFDLTVCIRSAQAKMWYDHDWSMITPVQAMQGRGLHGSATVFDLGAHDGIVALVLAKMVAPAGKVIALEGHPFNAESAQRNKELNRAENLTVLAAAVGEKSGTAKFSLNGIMGEDDSAPIVEVPAFSVDELSRKFGTPTAVFLDVEGYEILALAGAGETLQLQADWCVEVHVGEGLEGFGGTPERIVAFFPEDRFELFVTHDDHQPLIPIAQGRDLFKRRFFLVALARR